jgi:hypothetical protein
MSCPTAALPNSGRFPRRQHQRHADRRHGRLGGSASPLPSARLTVANLSLYIMA